jgi:FAD binding domain
MTYTESFVPKGAPASETYQGTYPIATAPLILRVFFTAVTIGSGVNWREAYEFIHTHNRTLVGGDCDTVGAAGGWVLGGGHSSLSHTYGLGK